MDSWGIIILLLVVAWFVLAGLPGAPVKGANRLILALGCVIIGFGHYLLTFGPWDNPLSLTVAPIFLVLGYCVLVPIALLRRQTDGSASEE